MKIISYLMKFLFITAAIFFTFELTFSQDWLNENWQYRRQVIIDNPGGTILLDYQVKLTLDASFDFTKSNNDGSDFRITDTDGVTLLSHWIEDWNPAETRATIWFNVPEIPVGGLSLYIYYGNSGATSIADGFNTFHAYDGFENYQLGTQPTSNFTNPGQWNRYSGNPLIAPGPSGSWDDQGATFASVIYDSVVLEYRMYYQGFNSTSHQIGLATSPDGLNWTKYPGNPILPPGASGSWDAQQTRVPMVWKEGSDDYRMIYTGRGTAAGQVGYATSTDGINWTKYANNPVFNDPTWSNDQTQNSGIIKVGNEYLMWYGNWGIRESGIAVSTDLINWTPYTTDPIFQSSGDPLDDRYSQHSPFSFKYEDFYYVLVPSYGVNSDYSKFYLYKSSSPYFPETDRHLVRIVQTSVSGEIGQMDNDTPFLFTLDIERTILHNDELWLFYGAEPGTGWCEGVLIETDINVALGDAPLPFGNLAWSNSGSIQIVDTPVKHGEKSVQFTNAASITGEFNPLSQGIVGAWMNRNSTSEGDLDIYLYGGSSLTCVAGLGRNGNFHFWNGDFHETAIVWDIDTLYLVTIEFNCSTGLFDFIVYDETLQDIVNETDVNFGNSSASINKGMLYTSSGYSGIAFADDYRVCKLTSPTPELTLGEEQSHMKSVNLTVFLEGPFNGIDMNTDLTNNPELVEGLPLNQPYNTAPWNYNGTEILTDIPPDVVDWVLVELRDAPDANSAIPATQFNLQAALLTSNGSIVTLDGYSPVSFSESVSQQLFVCIWHRNHLGIMSANALIESPAGTYSYDYSASISQAYNNGQKDLSAGIYGMIGGDANSDGIVNEIDANQDWTAQAGFSGYLKGDLNLNGQVNNPDKNEWWLENSGQETQVPD